MSLPADGTMALCAKCRRAIYCWHDVPIAFDGAGAIDNLHTAPPQIHWTNVRLPKVNHNAVPMTSISDRVLRCATCGFILQDDHEGVFCPNKYCSTRVDKD